MRLFAAPHYFAFVWRAQSRRYPAAGGHSASLRKVSPVREVATPSFATSGWFEGEEVEHEGEEEV